VADSGKLPYEKQVGLTGRTVSPKVYVAFGISGAVQHTCAIAGAGTVIAVNNDKQARIFDYADYGIIDDVKNITIGE
jgi:electron transfer flavoprotein alpha subunit